MPAKCPVCGKALPAPGAAARDPAAPRPPRPFCSERCRQVDLGRWLSGTYAIPGEPLREEEDEGGR